MTTNVQKIGRKENRAAESIRKAVGTALTYVPSAVIFGLIALYYIQLSHMGA